MERRKQRQPDSNGDHVGGRDRSAETGLRDGDRNGNQTVPTRKNGSATTSTRYDGQLYDGEYGDGNIAGILFLAGKRKSGKTWLQWRELAILATHRRIIFDTEDQYKAEKGYDVSTWAVFHQPGELRSYLATQLEADVLKVLYKPLSGNKTWHFRTVTRIVIEFAKRTKGVLYGVDEIDQFCDPHTPLKDHCPELNEIVEYGRHRNISMSCTSRRPHAVSRSLTAQCAEFRIFKTNEPRDKKYFLEFIGSEVNQLPRLGQYEYLWWADTGDCEVRGGKI